MTTKRGGAPAVHGIESTAIWAIENHGYHQPPQIWGIDWKRDVEVLTSNSQFKVVNKS